MSTTIGTCIVCKGMTVVNSVGWLPEGGMGDRRTNICDECAKTHLLACTRCKQEWIIETIPGTAFVCDDCETEATTQGSNE